ncbi:MAG: Bug family tripartite tricarboxylate transporter substrate binding protein [Nitrospinota bacterium]
MRKKTSFRWLATLAVTVAFLLAYAVPHGFAQWAPRKPIEFIIMAGAGGGADRIARLMQKIVTKNKWSPQPLVPINKPGGSGAEAMMYLHSKRGNPHVIMVTLNSFFTTPMLNKLPVSYKNLTPIYRLAMDTFVLWVNSESPIRTIDDYVKAVKAAGGKWKMGGTGKMQEDSLVTAMLEKTYGIKHTYIPFKGGGKVARELIGKHVDSTVNNPSEQLQWFKAGRSRPIAAFTPSRIEVLSDTPTFKELGKGGMVYYMQRSITAPAGVPKAARDWYVRLFDKLCNSSEWKAYTQKQALDRACLSGADMEKFFAGEHKKHEALLKSMGALK